MLKFESIPGPDLEARSAVELGLASSPRGASFGRLRSVAQWYAGCRGQVPAEQVQRARVVVFAGGHGIAGRTFEGVGLSAFAPEADAEILQELNAGAGPTHAIARRVNAGIRVVTLPSSAPIDTEDAMSAQVLNESLAAGQHAADVEIDEGADLLIPAELGVGATTVAAVIMGTLSSTEPVAIVGPGSGTTDSMWKTKVTVIRDAMFRARNLDPEELLEVSSSPSTAALVGFIIQAATRRTPLLVDGPLVATAAVIAERLAPGTKQWLYAASEGLEPAHHLALEDLGLEPLLRLELRAGQGCGALLALPLVESALDLAADEVTAISSQLD